MEGERRGGESRKYISPSPSIRHGWRERVFDGESLSESGEKVERISLSPTYFHQHHQVVASLDPNLTVNGSPSRKMPSSSLQHSVGNIMCVHFKQVISGTFIKNGHLSRWIIHIHSFPFSQSHFPISRPAVKSPFPLLTTMLFLEGLSSLLELSSLSPTLISSFTSSFSADSGGWDGNQNAQGGAQFWIYLGNGGECWLLFLDRPVC